MEALRGLNVAFADGATRLLSVPRSWPPAALVTQATDTALRFIPPEARVPAEELGDLLRRLQCNVFSVSSAVETDDCDVGRAAFVGAMHFVNHSCAPNVVFESEPLWGTEGLECEDTPAFSLVCLRDVPCGAQLRRSRT